MKDVRAPVVMEPPIVKVAPYITTTITDSVDAAFRPPEKSPTTFYSRNQLKLERIESRESDKRHRELTACLRPRLRVSSTFSE